MNTPAKPDRLRSIVTSKPLLIAALLIVFYLLGGFLALPALLKWQAEKQVHAQLGHALSLGKVSFNPLLFRLEVDDLVLVDPEGKPLLSSKRLLVDFELRSIIDRAWTVAEARIEAPVVSIELDRNGRHNFSSLLERLPASGSEPEASAGLPRFLVQQVVLSEAQVDFADHWHEEPRVAQIVPLSIELDNLSSLPGEAAAYRLALRTVAGETLEAHGELALNPVLIKGRLALGGFQVATLVRSLPRLLAIDSPAGQVDLAARFDLRVDEAGTLSGVVQEVDFKLASLSLSAAGAAGPLLAMETLSLQQGHIDLAARQVDLAGFRLADGRVVVAFDEQGRLNWGRLLRAERLAPETIPGPASETTGAQSEAEVAVAPDAGADSGASVSAGADAAAADATWRAAVGRAEISAIAVAFSDSAQALAVDIAGLAFETAPRLESGPAGTRLELAQAKLLLGDARIKRASEALTVPESRITAGQITVESAGARVAVSVGQPQIGLDGLHAQGGPAGVDLRRLAFAGRVVSLLQAGDRLEVVIDAMRASVEGVAAASGADTMKLNNATLASERLALAQTVAVTRVEAGAAQLSAAGLVAQQGANRIRWQDAAFDAATMVAALERAPSAASSANLRLDGAALRLKAVAVRALDAPSEIAQIASAKLGARSLALALPRGPVDLRGDGLNAVLSDAIFRSPADPETEMLRLGSATIAGGTLRLRDQVLTIDKVAVADGTARTWLDDEGRFNGLIVTRSAAAAAAEAAPGSAASDAAWRLAVKATEVDRFALGFEDRSGGPPLAVGLESIAARIAGFETGVTTPMRVDFKAKLASGGEIDAKGTIRADNGATNLRLRLASIALAPVQPFLSEFAELTLASGSLSSAGRLRYGDPAAAGGQLAFQGSFAVDQLQIDEIDPQRPFVTWEALETDDLQLKVAPNRLDIGELRLVAPAGRFIIAEDQSINLSDVLKKPTAGQPGPGGEAAAGEMPPEVAESKEHAAAEDPFPVSVARVRVSDGVLEFADLSLRPQFGARMHELKGVITGLGTDPGRSAKLQLDARVDKYGAATIAGQINVFRPRQLTDIEMTFRNLTMASLSPYVVRFAGRRIEGGQLSLDLQYKVKESKLRGENKIVLKKVKLGEKVKTPGAADLPLDLAIAILTDSNGVIDIGLPVSGDLNDPDFGYGAVVGKALGNLIGGIVTAPFRALGALFGGGDDANLESIDFAPGRAVLAPPQREKLAAVAHAMQERKTLKLRVPPVQAAEVDTPALRSLAVRTAVATRMGLQPEADEDPGPIDPANRRAQVAIEMVFSELYAAEVLAAVKQRAIAAIPAGGTLSSGPPPDFYQSLLDRMIKEHPLSDGELAQLGMQRARAIVGELTGAAGVDAKRVALGEARPASAASEQAVTLKLELEVAK